ncbi:MAG: prolyl oligopeptidase family serine peptidase [Prevotellaceae bacterium]|nr:prolyl oligopeptidase family serine peptidase [Prevotellaceae bacterium]
MNNKHQKLIGLALAALLTSSYGICQNPTDEAGVPAGPIPGVGRPMPDNPGKQPDAALQAVLDETLNKFIQCTYTDAETGKTMEYNLFIPESYDDKTAFPLILFMGDASTARREVTVPLTQGYGGVIWATAAEQAKHPCFIVVPQYTTVTVNDNFNTSYEVEMTIRLVEYICSQYTIDTKRLYTTGQSMGGMMSMYFNVAHPKFFAASLYAGCQWDTTKMASFATDSFIYAVAGGDERASGGMAALRKVLEAEGKQISSAEWSAKLPEEEQKANTLKLLSEGNNVNFIVLTKGSVLPEGYTGHPGGEHMHSFDYIYRLEAARDWIFRQRLE